MELNKYIDHTNLKAVAKEEDIKNYVKKLLIMDLVVYVLIPTMFL